MPADWKEITSRAWVIGLLNEPVIARLATADPRTLQPHVVPVWFAWDGSAIWISSFRSTRKIRDLLQNPRISIAIDTAEGSDKMRAVVFEGAAQLITDPALVASKSTEIYTRYLGLEGVQKPEPQSWIHDPENMLICLVPQRVLAWGQTE